ncbi:alpha/beta fold hydrolase [Pontibacter vulgaris]|uniref:alpha/beta fold hydrolase n=1 Tax=Pontibacter vulgaris TaxID=2905679 RepID=UPI001FA6E2D9|nr:alpha/beta hydrolase [Pontibacter vulgaris]
MKEVTSTELKEIEINGIALSYTEQGEGEPIILVHGNLSDYRMWEGQTGPFSEKYRVISYSRRYAYPAKSTDDKAGYTIIPHADDLAALIKKLNLDQVHLVGHSFGAYTALLTAIEHPELVKSLCLAEPPVASLLVNSEEGNRLLFEWETQTILPSAQAFESGDDLQGVKIFLDGIMADTSFYDKMPPEVQQQINDNIQEMKGIICSKMIFELYPFITCADIRKVRAPTLLITAEKSPRFLHVIANELEKCLPKPERALIPNSSHEMEVDNPQALNEAILRFIARHSAHS